MMRFNLLIALLVLSVLLNGFFLGGYWLASFKAKEVSNAKQRIEEVVKQLDLTPEQREKFHELKSRAVGIRKPYLRRMARLRAMFWKTVTSSSANDEDIRKVIHEMAVERERYQRKIAAIIAEFFHVLNQDQKRKFLEISNNSKLLKALISG